MHTNHLGFLLNVDFDSIDLGWGLRHCISNKLQGECGTPGHGPLLSSKGFERGVNSTDGRIGRIPEPRGGRLIGLTD